MCDLLTLAGKCRTNYSVRARQVNSPAQFSKPTEGEPGHPVKQRANVTDAFTLSYRNKPFTQTATLVTLNFLQHGFGTTASTSPSACLNTKALSGLCYLVDCS